MLTFMQARRLGMGRVPTRTLVKREARLIKKVAAAPAGSSAATLYTSKLARVQGKIAKRTPAYASTGTGPDQNTTTTSTGTTTTTGGDSGGGGGYYFSPLDTSYGTDTAPGYTPTFEGGGGSEFDASGGGSDMSVSPGETPPASGAPTKASLGGGAVAAIAVVGLLFLFSKRKGKGAASAARPWR